jgi:hypothetical protein
MTHYYKDNDDKLHALDNPAFIGLLPEAGAPYTELTESEYEALVAAEQTPPPVFPILTSGEFQQGLINMGVLTYGGILAAVKQAELPYPLKQIVDAAVAGGTPTPEQLQDAPYNLPAPIATGVAMAIAGGLTLTAADRDKITFTWVTMVQVGRDYPIIGQLQLVLGIPDAVMDQLFLKRGESTNG